MTTHPSAPFWDYTQAVLPFHTPEDLSGFAPLSLPLREKSLQRLLRSAAHAQDRGQSHVLLLGLGQGDLAAEFCRELPDGLALVVLEFRPGLVRGMLERTPGLLDWWGPQSRHQIISDTSIWSALLLLQSWPGLSSVLPLRNPELFQAAETNTPDTILTQYAHTQRLISASAKTTPETTASPVSLSAAAILHPDESGLENFFAQFPEWCHELVVIWDAESPPCRKYKCATQLREFARPLESDFAAQRNAMLMECTGDWILYLDADERLPPEAWENIRGRVRDRSASGFWLPRLTPYPDEESCLVGFGLWPDLQLRLFRNRDSLRFKNRVHERLHGLEGAVSILPGVSILHLNQLLKSAEEIDEKYKIFNQAGNTRHKRSSIYPYLPRTFFTELGKRLGDNAAIPLPE